MGVGVGCGGALSLLHQCDIVLVLSHCGHTVSYSALSNCGPMVMSDEVFSLSQFSFQFFYFKGFNDMAKIVPLVSKHA